MFGANLRLDGLVEEATAFLKKIDKLNNYKRFCSEQVSNLEKALCDLDHKLELQSLDCVSMSKLTTNRKKILQQRRKYKDEIERINAFLSKTPNSQQIHDQLWESCKEVKSTDKRLEARTYRPRILAEEFS